MRVLVVGGSGVLGRALLPLLVASGHEVWATTRRPSGAAQVSDRGAVPLVCDAFDAGSVAAAVDEAAPQTVVHQLTALPSEWGALRKGTTETDRLRRLGTRNLVRACLSAGVQRLVAESIAFLYAPGAGRAAETDPPWLNAPASYAETVRAALDLEREVHDAARAETGNLTPVVLRYGTLYGPGTWWAAEGDILRRIRRRALPVIGTGAGMTSFLHVQDAARATARALEPTAPGGTYNIVDDDPVSFAELLPAIAKSAHAPTPRRVPTWLARPVAGAAATAIMTRQRAADNAATKRIFDWSPQRPSWRGQLPG